MIKRWTIHLEIHWGYWPKFWIRRNPQPGDRVVDGGVLGTLRRCPTCQDGLLHEADLSSQQKYVRDVLRMASYIDRPGGSNHGSALAMDLNAPMPSDIVDAPTLLAMGPRPYSEIPKAKVSMVARDDQDLTELLLRAGSLKYKIGEIVWYQNVPHRVVAFEEDKRVLLRRLKD